MSSIDFNALSDFLKGIVGDEYVFSDEAAMLAYVREAGLIEGIPPRLVVKPGSTEEIAKVLRLANEYKVPVYVRGGGSSYSGAGICFKQGILLDMTRLKGIIEVNEDSNTVQVWAGTGWTAFNYELRKRGLMTGFRGPASSYTATVGGSSSVCSIGLGSAKYGGGGDQVLGLEVVLPTGIVINTGSCASERAEPFMRYVLGPDLTGLFLGDHGMLGVKTKVTFRLYPLPSYEEYAEYGFKTEANAAKAINELLRRNICISDLMAFEKFATEVRAKKVTYWQGYEAIVILKMEAEDKAAIDAQKNVIRNVLSKYNGVELPENKMAKTMIGGFFDVFFYARRDAGFSLGMPILTPAGKVAEFWARMRAFIKSVEDKWKKYVNYSGMVLIASANACESVPTFYVPWNYDMDPAARKEIAELWRAYYSEALKAGGCLCMMGRGASPLVFNNFSQNYISFIKSVKKALDPNNILNPGLWPIEW